MEWTSKQMEELEKLARRSPKAYVRVKALAVLNVARGRHRQEVAAMFGVHRVSVGLWVRRYRELGASGLEVAPGRGRRPQVDRQEVEDYVRQSPRRFGLDQTRWTLRALALTVPSLRGFTEAGVYQALRRLGFRYKRGQPHLHSPDPEYLEKRGSWSRPSPRPGTSQGR